jgi:large subunit ribosomal protein L25
MQHYELKGQVREIGGKAAIKAIRREGLVPCIVYGNGVNNVTFTVNAKELNILLSLPQSYIIDINLGDQKHTAVLHELQFHPVSDECLHVDFLAVNETKPIVIDVPITVSGHSKGVQLGGKFVQNARTLRISALMNDLPDSVNVDITELGIAQRIKAGDLSYDKISVVTEKNTIICQVRPTRNAK